VRVLVVDDTPDIRFMLGVLLGDAGMEVEEVSSGRAAVDRILDADAPALDAVVLDHRMPVMTGLDVARAMAEAGANVPTVLFSAYLNPALHAEALGMGATPVVKTDLDGLLAALRGFEPAYC
jgi:CheY-like chemotaxis protein